MRGGFGIFYDRVGGGKFVHGLEQGVPYAITLDYTGGAALPFSISNPILSMPLGFVPRYFDPATGASSNLNTPSLPRAFTRRWSRQYNLAFQYQLAQRWVFEAGLRGSSGINLADYNHTINLAQLASPSNPINGHDHQHDGQRRVSYLMWDTSQPACKSLPTTPFPTTTASRSRSVSNSRAASLCRRPIPGARTSAPQRQTA